MAIPHETAVDPIREELEKEGRIRIDANMISSK
jgi:hypothetical protein